MLLAGVVVDKNDIVVTAVAVADVVSVVSVVVVLPAIVFVVPVVGDDTFLLQVLFL